jgi:single-stranded-DNA-specific exonuclease
MTRRRKTYRWEFRDCFPEQAKSLVDRYRLNSVVASVLASRGLGLEHESLIGFMNPKLSTLHDPLLMADMEKGVERTAQAIERGECIVVFGDYDADGITSTSLMFKALKRAGAACSWYVPHRIDEGYGISMAALERIAAGGARLIITVDNGISALAQVRRAQELGMDVIVTDHHQPGPDLPEALAVINPNRRDCGYPCKHLTGVGVAFKFAHALLKRMGVAPAEAIEFLRSLLDLVAIGTIADFAPLAGENRVLVSHGLQRIAESSNLGIQTLRAHLKLNGAVSATHVGFQIAPRLNAAGRTSHAEVAVRLLTTDDPEEAQVIVEELEGCNRLRRTMEGKIFDECMAFVDSQIDLSREPVVVVDGHGWHLGVIGIVASRVMDQVDRPVIILTHGSEYAKGSGRSVGGFNLFQALTACSDHLTAFGGHPQAAGLTIAPEKIAAFRAEINEFARENHGVEPLTPSLVIDAEVDCRALDLELMNHLRYMEPFGQSNPHPVLATRGIRLHTQPRVVGEKHLKLQLVGDGVVVSAIGFNMGHLAGDLNAAGRVPLDVAFSPTVNTWQNETRVEMELKDLRLAAS